MPTHLLTHLLTHSHHSHRRRKIIQSLLTQAQGTYSLPYPHHHHHSLLSHFIHIFSHTPCDSCESNTESFHSDSCCCCCVLWGCVCSLSFPPEYALCMPILLRTPSQKKAQMCVFLLFVFVFGQRVWLCFFCCVKKAGRYVNSPNAPACEAKENGGK